MTKQNTQFKIGDRVRFKPEHHNFMTKCGMKEEFIVSDTEEDAVLDEKGMMAFNYRLELVPNSNQQEYTQQKEKTMKTMKNTQTKQKLGKTQLKQDYAWALVDKQDGFIYDTYLSRSVARHFKDDYNTIKKVKLEVIGRG